jgi:sortase A
LIVLGLAVLLVAGALLGYPQVYRWLFPPRASQASLSATTEVVTTATPIVTPSPSPMEGPPTVTPTARPGPAVTMTPTPATMPAPGAQEPIVERESARGWPASRIVIPRLGVDVPVVEVSWRIVEEGGVKKTVWEMADHAAGHHANSASPGQKGNVVISGHHSLKGAVFERLSELAPGDEVILETIEGSSYRYVVEESLILEEAGASIEERRAHARYMDPTPDETLTLISCWPSWTNTHRVVVVAKAR